MSLKSDPAASARDTSVPVSHRRRRPLRNLRSRNRNRNATVPICPVLAALHRLTTTYTGGNGFFILDEIFVTLRQECTSLSRDALLETLRTYYRDGQIRFRRGFGSQLQFALKGDRK